MLNGKVAVVTGASRGIGRQIAISMAKEGAVVIVNYNGSAAKAEDVVKEITEAGGQAEAVQCNVSDYSAAEVFLKDIISRYKRIDILVNNAGITRDNLLMKMTEEEFDAVIDTNLKGAFNCIKHVSRQMLKQKGGRIINISSVWGVCGASCEVAYSATKGGINAMTRALAKELAPSSIQVNAIACGAIDTEMNQFLDEEERNALLEEIPAGRMGRAEEVGKLAYQLGSEDSYLTGQIIQLDGGWI